MQALRDHVNPGADALAASAAGHPSRDDVPYRILGPKLGRTIGMVLASAVSIAFWLPVVSFALSSVNVVPTPGAMALTGIGIAGVVSAAIFAISSQA